MSFNIFKNPRVKTLHFRVTLMIDNTFLVEYSNRIINPKPLAFPTADTETLMRDLKELVEKTFEEEKKDSENID